MNKFDAVLDELNSAFSDAIAATSESWPADPTDDDYNDLAKGDLFLLDAQTIPFAIYCLMRHFLRDRAKGQVSLALEMFIEFIDVRDKDDDAVPFKTGSYDELYAAKLERLTQVTKMHSKAISSWLTLIAAWRDVVDDEDDDEDDVRRTIERARHYWARRGER